MKDNPEVQFPCGDDGQASGTFRGMPGGVYQVRAYIDVNDTQFFKWSNFKFSNPGHVPPG